VSALPSCKKVRRESGEDVRVSYRGVTIGAGRPVVVVGPCSVESREMITEVALAVRRIFVEKLGFSNVILRGGVWKPRTSPYSFQGHGERALEWLREAGDRAKVPVATEVMDPRQVGAAADYVDFLWVGARNMQNTPLLRELAKVEQPVLLKRHFGALIDEWLCAAEYLLAEGKEEVVLVERGTRGLNEYARFTLDVTVIPVVKIISRLPLIVDVSHPAGRRELVPALARAALAAGADGIMVEAHPDPNRALSDSQQQLSLGELEELARNLRGMGLI
jgi:3-deoxy-7-phosphoheptulonate synthase